MNVKLAAAALAVSTMLSSGAFANGLIVSSNGFSQIGINDDGSLDANTSNGYVGIGYNFSGQGGRTGFQDALTPGCPCEAWGVSANGIGGQVGQSTGNQNIGVTPSSAGTTANVSAGATSTFTSNTYLNQSGLTGLSVTQAFSLAVQTATGALFQDHVTIHNGTGAAVTDLRYARAMDWDVPPTEFAEVVTIKGTGTTSTLLHSTDNGFANANPITAVSDGGIVGPINADGTTGPADHGSLFVFGFGDLADGADYSFNIYYGSGADRTDALALLGGVSPELYSLGMSNDGMGGAKTDYPTFVFAFNGVGGSVVVPPTGVPEPATLGVLGMGLLGLAGLRRRGA
jgi:type IV pilus assembly protein PilY1